MIIGAGVAGTIGAGVGGGIGSTGEELGGAVARE